MKISLQATVVIAAVLAVLCLGVAITGFTSLGGITDPDQIADAKGFAWFWTFLASVAIGLRLLALWLTRTQKATKKLDLSCDKHNGCILVLRYECVAGNRPMDVHTWLIYFLAAAGLSLSPDQRAPPSPMEHCMVGARRYTIFGGAFVSPRSSRFPCLASARCSRLLSRG